jgi:regulator of replication initiation timing
MKELEILNDRVDRLLQQYTALQAENSQLQETIAQQKMKIEELEKKATTRVKKESKVSDAPPDQVEKLAIRKEIDGLIAEIDKVLITLND